MTNTYVTALTINSGGHINSVGHVFAAAAGGVFRSTNDGASWTDISSGLIAVGGNVWALAMDSGGYCPRRNGWWRSISQRLINYLGASGSEPEARPAPAPRP